MLEIFLQRLTTICYIDRRERWNTFEITPVRNNQERTNSKWLRGVTENSRLQAGHLGSVGVIAGACIKGYSIGTVRECTAVRALLSPNCNARIRTLVMSSSSETVFAAAQKSSSILVFDFALVRHSWVFIACASFPSEVGVHFFAFLVYLQ